MAQLGLARQQSLHDFRGICHDSYTCFSTNVRKLRNLVFRECVEFREKFFLVTLGTPQLYKLSQLFKLLAAAPQNNQA